MRHVVIAAGAVLSLLLAVPHAGAQSLGEVSAATGISGTLSRQGAGSSKSALGSVKSSLSKSTRPRGMSSGGSGSRSSRSKPTASRSGGSRAGGASGGGVSGSSGARGSQSSAWLQGGSGWATGGGARGPSRRPRS